MQNLAELGKVVGNIQTDTFCESCGYNLHAQPVVRDDRLGVLITGCPECGRYSAVGQTTTAARLWLNRLATTLLVCRVVFLLGLFSLSSTLLGVFAYGQMKAQTSMVQRDPPPAPQRRPTQYYSNWVYAIRDQSDPREKWQLLDERILLATISISLSLVTGILFAAFFWHVRKLAGVIAILPSLLGGGVALWIWVVDEMSEAIQSWGDWQILLSIAVQCVVILLGVWIGRPVVRALLLLLVPPKPRQHLAFLWTADGKRLKLPAGE